MFKLCVSNMGGTDYRHRYPFTSIAFTHTILIRIDDEWHLLITQYFISVHTAYDLVNEWTVDFEWYIRYFVARLSHISIMIIGFMQKLYFYTPFLNSIKYEFAFTGFFSEVVYATKHKWMISLTDAIDIWLAIHFILFYCMSCSSSTAATTPSLYSLLPSACLYAIHTQADLIIKYNNKIDASAVFIIFAKYYLWTLGEDVMYAAMERERKRIRETNSKIIINNWADFWYVFSIFPIYMVYGYMGLYVCIRISRFVWQHTSYHKQNVMARQFE